VGVDVGGTFTDVVSVDDVTGEVRSCKVPTVPDNRAQGVLDGLRALLRAGEACASLAHGTTTVTNAIVEGRVAPVGLVTTRGFRDVLEIARMNRAHLYRLELPARAEPLVPRRRRLEITERVGPDGTVQTPLAPAELEGIVAALRAEGVEAVAVCLLHAYANPAHEQALRRALEPHFRHVSVSSEINAEFREYERTCTTALNASVMPLADRYVDGLTAALAGTGGGGPALRLLHSAGGMMSVAAAKARPLAMALSGPAAGVAAAAHVARALGVDRALAFDMGGTTTDVCLISDGAAETTSQRKLADYPVRLPMVAVESIGAGGGSLARVDAVGARLPLDLVLPLVGVVGEVADVGDVLDVQDVDAVIQHGAADEVGQHRVAVAFPPGDLGLHRLGGGGGLREALRDLYGGLQHRRRAPCQGYREERDEERKQGHRAIPRAREATARRGRDTPSPGAR